MIQNLHKLRFWVVTVVVVLVASGTFSLGQWQLRRAAQKESLQLAIEQQSQQPTLDTTTLERADKFTDALNREAILKGVWAPKFTVFLDNRPMSGKTGFVVVTPLVLEGSKQAILVQRGWVQRNFIDRTRLPTVFTPTGAVLVRGRIAPPPSKLYAFNGNESGRIRQNIDVSKFSEEVSLSLLPGSLLEFGAASEGLSREWAPPNLGVEKHYGYAFQWFALSALTVVLSIWFQIVVPMRLKASKTS